MLKCNHSYHVDYYNYKNIAGVPYKVNFNGVWCKALKLESLACQDANPEVRFIFIL